MLLLLEAQEGNWDEVDMMIRAFQGATMALKYADVPVVVAPAGLALGGGCEIALHADRVQAAAETYMGLVEVGRRPDSGRRRHEGDARARDGGRAAGADPLPFVQRVFETIGFAQGLDERPRRAAPRLPARRGRHLDEPRSADRGREGRARSRASPTTCGRSRAAPSASAARACWRRSSSASTSRGARGASAITTRSSAASSRGSSPAATSPHAATLTEQQLLDLEREAFLSLCGERKTQERIAHTLKTGKPLRN